MLNTGFCFHPMSTQFYFSPSYLPERVGGEHEVVVVDPDDGHGPLGRRPLRAHPPHRLHRLQREDLVHLSVRLKGGKEVRSVHH